MKEDVIIVGAGAAGLAAARELSAHGCHVVVVEARDRIGGRILTHQDQPLNVPIELGAEFVHGRPEVTWKIIHEAGLLAVDLPFAHLRRSRGQLKPIEDINDELGPILGGLSRLGRADISFAEYLRRRRFSPKLAEARRFAINFVEGFDAADIERISAKSLAEEQQGVGNLDDETQFRLVNGYAALIQHLRGELDERRVMMRLRTQVEEIRWSASGVEVLAREDGQAARYRAAKAIITLPLGVLQSQPGAVGAIRFTPEVPSIRSAAGRLVSGSIVKLVLRFREAFWEHERGGTKTGNILRDAVFLHLPDADFPTWWTMRPMHAPLLTAWAGGPRATALAALSDSRLIDAALRSLARLLNMRENRLRGELEHVYTHNWVTDPLSRGAYSYVGVDGMTARAQLARPIDNTLFFAGEATDTSGQASTVAGAIASGQRVVRQLLKRR